MKRLKRCSRSQCRGSGDCFWQNASGRANSKCDEYTFVCKKCGSIRRKVIYYGSDLLEEWDTICPFCGRSQRDHISTPKKYLRGKFVVLES